MKILHVWGVSCMEISFITVLNKIIKLWLAEIQLIQFENIQT